MNISKLRSTVSSRQQDIEFPLLLGWLLFYPSKGSFLYFLLSAFILAGSSFRRILMRRIIGLSPYSLFLLCFNLIFLFSSIFATVILKSILATADIFIVSIYWVLYLFENNKPERFLLMTAYLISFSSLINVIFYAVNPTVNPATTFFRNPILQGIASGAAGLILLTHVVAKSRSKIFLSLTLTLLVVNLGGIIISRSKAALLGFTIIALMILLVRKPKFVSLLILILILLFIIPNPIKGTFKTSLTKDPYIWNRIDIWKMSCRIFGDNLLTGVGPNNFSEISKKYNFPQEKGLSKYGKIPMTAHNEYLGLIAETGLLGLLFLSALIFTLVKKIIRPPRFTLPKFLLLYFLFQAFLFNFIFNLFYFFLILFLFKIVFEESVSFIPNSTAIKISFTFSLILLLIVCYISPFYVNLLLKKSLNSKTIPEGLFYLKKAQAINPLDATVWFRKAELHYRDFQKTSNLDAFASALMNVRQAQRANPADTGSYALENHLFLTLLSKKITYTGLLNEAIEPLKKAEAWDPFNPFIKYQKARIYLEFNQREKAKESALQALGLEPGFVSALIFLHNHFNYIPEEKVFRERIRDILKGYDGLELKPGSYLFKLAEVPK